MRTIQNKNRFFLFLFLRPFGNKRLALLVERSSGSIFCGRKIIGARCFFGSKLKINSNLFGSLLTYSYLCNVKVNVLTIQVSFLRGQAVYVTTHFKAARQVRFYCFLAFPYFRKLFIIILRNPLLLAMLRLMDISLLPKNIKTSIASGDISKWCLISSVMLRIP